MLRLMSSYMLPYLRATIISSADGEITKHLRQVGILSPNHPITKALNWRLSMNRNQRRMAAFNQRKAAEKSMELVASSKDTRLELHVALSLSGCSARVYKATMSLPLRSKSYASSDNICLPDVAIFSAGHRKSADTVTAR